MWNLVALCDEHHRAEHRAAPQASVEGGGGLDRRGRSNAASMRGNLSRRRLLRTARRATVSAVLYLLGAPCVPLAMPNTLPTSEATRSPRATHSSKICPKLAGFHV